MQSALSQTQLSLREGNLYTGLAKEPVDPIVDIAADLRVQTRPISPDEQTKIKRPITKIQELHFGWRIPKNVVDIFSSLQQCLGDQIDIRTVSDANWDCDSGPWITKRPIDQMLTHEL